MFGKLRMLMIVAVACCAFGMGCQADGSDPQFEDCTDGRDNDGDGRIDCLDPDCDGYSGCDQNCTPPNTCCVPEVCNDGRDNDCDGRIDCADSDCSSHPSCSDSCEPNCCIDHEICNDNRDNDCDGRTDCDDPECHGSQYCCTPEACNDGQDNDCDGDVDCEDSDCWDEDICHCGSLYVSIPHGGEIDIETGMGGWWGQSVPTGWDAYVDIVLEDMGIQVWITANSIQVNRLRGLMQGCYPGEPYDCDFSSNCDAEDVISFTKNVGMVDHGNIRLTCQ